MPTRTNLYGPGNGSLYSPGWWADAFHSLTILVDLLREAVESTMPGIEADLAAETTARAAADALLIPLTQKAAANGVATLGVDSKIPVAQVPDLSATFVQPPAGAQATQRLLTKVRQGVDAKLLILGDSTSNEVAEWAYLLAGTLGARFPTATVRYRLWDDATTAYAAPTTVTTGSGAGILDIYNCSVAGVNCDYYLLPDARFAAAIPAVDPDLTLISQGHNEDDSTAASAHFRDRLLMLTETVAAAVPSTDVVLVAQNPQMAPRTSIQIASHAARAVIVSEVAALRGYGTVSVHQAILDLGSIATYVNPDGVHLLPAGSAVAAAEIAKAFVYTPGVNPRPRASSALQSSGEALLTNADFAAFSAAVPTGWVNDNATISKDLTNYESVNGYGVRLQSASAAAGSMYQDAPNIRMLRGQWVTVAVRQYHPAGVTFNAGRVGIQTLASGVNIESKTSRAVSYAGGYRWTVISIFVPTNATTLRVRLYADTGTSGAGDTTVDRVVIRRGLLPAGGIGTGGPVGLQGPVGPAPNAYPMRVGEYYNICSGPVAASIMLASRVYLIPWDVKVAGAIDRIAVVITALAGGADIRFGYYADTGANAPDLATMENFGALAAVAPFTELTISKAVGVGRHWIAVQAQNAPGTLPSIFQVGNNTVSADLPVKSSTVMLSAGYYVSYGGATLPTTGALVDQVPVPAVRVRAA